MNIKFLGGALYSYWPLDMNMPRNKKEDVERAIKNMRRLSKITEENDVTLGMEVLNCYETYMMNTCSEAIDFVKAVHSSQVNIMLGTFHMNIEENSITAAIRQAGARLGHFHISEQNMLVPGKGSLP